MGKIMFLLLGVVALCGCGDADVTIINRRFVSPLAPIDPWYYYDLNSYTNTGVVATFGADRVEAELKYGESMSQTFHSAGYVAISVSGYTGKTLAYGDLERYTKNKSFEISNGLFSDKKYEIAITDNDITSSEK